MELYYVISILDRNRADKMVALHKEAGITVDQYLANQAAGLPLRRMSDPDDCVGTALFLAAPASDFLTGNLLYPDGGLTAIG